MLENIYEMVYELKIMNGIAMWEFCEAWKESENVQSRFCRKVMGIPN